VSEYLVEVYVPRAAVASMPRLEYVSRVAEELTRSGVEVELLGSILVPDDETCFYRFTAQSDAAVLAAASRSGLQVERVMEAVSEARASRCTLTKPSEKRGSPS
jgi:hypothetical protein